MTRDIRNEVKTYYGNIAKQVGSQKKESCGCGTSCCSGSEESKLYSQEFLQGLTDEVVNASLGCANPITMAGLQEGEIVLDLGSGGGIDAFISSKYVGHKGKVYGLDMTDDMLKLANQNKEKMAIHNVEFIKGYIEDVPLGNEAVDVVMSNCVINLSESKERALSEAFRVLKKGGRLAIADIVRVKEAPQEIAENLEMWLGCIAGALPVDEYKRILKKVGFTQVEITPVHVYTKEIIQDILKKKNLTDVYQEVNPADFDGVFVGAHVKAFKE